MSYIEVARTYKSTAACGRGDLWLGSRFPPARMTRLGRVDPKRSFTCVTKPSCKAPPRRPESRPGPRVLQRIKLLRRGGFRGGENYYPGSLRIAGWGSNGQTPGGSNSRRYDQQQR